MSHKMINPIIPKLCKNGISDIFLCCSGWCWGFVLVNKPSGDWSRVPEHWYILGFSQNSKQIRFFNDRNVTNNGLSNFFR